MLHKSATCVFILTQEENVSKSEKLNVHFFDSVQLEAKILTFCREFAVLYVDGIHESSTSVELRSQPFSFSEAVCVVPKTVRAFQKIRGQIPRPSCTSYNVDGSLAPTTNNYFLFICHHEGTQLMTPAPIFHEERTVNGFVIADCFVSRLRHGPSKKVDIHAKICVKASAVEIWLQEALGLDWRVNLVFLLSFPKNREFDYQIMYCLNSLAARPGDF